MKLTFLGTGAGEGYPGYWCECPHCSYARSYRGKNLRTNSCLAIDERLLIDLGPSCFDNAARFGVRLTQLRTLLVTHPHEDHLYPQSLIWRETDESLLPLGYAEKMHHGGPRFTAIPKLDVYGNSFVLAAMGRALGSGENLKLEYHEIREGTVYESDGYRFMPIRGNHGPEKGFAHSFAVSKGEKTILYASDTGRYEEDQLRLIEKYQYDIVIMEGTMGLHETGGGHMCLAENIRLRKRLEEAGCLKEGTRVILTHLSPHWCPPHDWYEAIVAPERMELAYDGKQVEI